MQKLKSGLAGIITGASSGIGKALAEKLASQYQAKLVLNARKKDLLEQTAELVKRAGGEATVVVGDISDRAVASELASECLAKYESIDLLVNNAGFARPGTLTDLTPDDWHAVFNVNFFGAVYATYAVLPHFLECGAGKIVNVSSVAGKVAFPGSVCYSSSKFALTGFSEGLAAELASKDIDVVTVCPGWVRTEFFENVGISEKSNPTVIAERDNFQGWLMRKFLSVSAEDVANDIIKACNAGGSQEIVLTGPGVIMERLAGVAPGLTFALAKKIPSRR
jgi:short-subunit dehydrogenase